MLRVEVGARALRVRLVSREEAWASAGVQRHSLLGNSPGSGVTYMGSFYTFHSVKPSVHLREEIWQLKEAIGAGTFV